MSAQDLMNGYAQYTDAEELAAQIVATPAQESSPLCISFITGVSLTVTAEHAC
ncbi:LxmA leader domain family RiPP [Streptomyces sp. NPDC001508]|uniref:LxmA leader domain family RiPP n=1 Tax=Streptomyces sp. NPDC001508 TaxID=3154656 RepID=UPI00332B0865